MFAETSPITPPVKDASEIDFSDQNHDLFQKELPELLKTHEGQYVIYVNGERKGIGPDHMALMNEHVLDYTNDRMLCLLIDPGFLDEETAD